jgi:hypothetical protein
LQDSQTQFQSKVSFSDAEILYNKKPKTKAPRKKKPKVEIEIDTTTVEGKKRQRRLMRKSEKIISQQLSESGISESLNTSILANLSIESIKSEHENIELDLEFSEVGSTVRKRQIKKFELNQEIDNLNINQIGRNDRVYVMSGLTLISIIYCALNICKSEIQMSDLIRMIREGHLSYYNTKEFLPEDLIEQDVPLSYVQYHTVHMISYENFRKNCSAFIQIIPDLPNSIKPPKFLQLVRRYLDELNLPTDLNDYIERLISFIPPEMKTKSGLRRLVPNFEGRAMAYIIFVLKLLFGLDGFREKKISNAARKVNNELKTCGFANKIFVYEDWRRFIEYREVLLEKFYYPAIFNHEFNGDKPYVAYNTMIEKLRPKTKKIESANVTVKNEKRMQTKLELKETLSKLSEKHKEVEGIETMEKLSFDFSLTPLKDNLQNILDHGTGMEIRRDIATLDFTNCTCEPLLKPSKLVNTLKNVGIEMQTKKSNFPQIFALVQSKSQKKVQNSAYEMKFDEMSEDEYRNDLTKRMEMEKSGNAKEEQNYHEARLKALLEERWIRRRKIRRDKSESKKNLTATATDQANASTESVENDIDGPRNFKETNILSDNDNDESDEDDKTNDLVDEIDLPDDPELTRIFQEHEKSLIENNEKLTLVVPDFNMRQRVIRVKDEQPHGNLEDYSKSLPKSFVWLLKIASMIASSILHQPPMRLYHQVLIIENQFMNAYQPVELVKNVLLKQNVKPGELARFFNLLEDLW